MTYGNYEYHSQKPQSCWEKLLLGSTKDIINAQPLWFITTPILSNIAPPNKKKNFSRTRSEQSCYKVLTCSQEFFVKLLPVLDYLIKSGKKKKKKRYETWKCSDVGIDGVHG